ncbi:MAG: PAS domain S-box protein, partial [Vicinamibacterales bacterium]
SPDFVGFFDRDGQPTYMNRAARAMCGLAPMTPVLGTTLEAALGGQAQELRDLMERARMAGGMSHCETHIVHRDGTRTPVSTLALAQITHQGTVEFYAIIARDISERLRDEQSILASEQRFRRVVESLQEVLFETDLEGRWTYLNPAWTEITGFAVEESLGRNAREFVLDDDAELHDRRFGLLTRGDHALARYEVRFRTRDGGFRWIELHARTTQDATPTGTSGTLRDITEQRELSDALVRAGQEALAASRLKSEFVANMSHEVRTPINGVIGLTTILLDTTLTPEQLDLCEGIRSSAEALLTIVNDVLDLSKIEAGKLTIEPVSFELRKELSHALEPVSVRARRKGLTLRMSCGSDVPAVVISDPTRIRQVLINLADNAIKFTQQGAVTITVCTLRSDTETPRLRFEVTDQGIGIAADKLDAIFEKFTQADSSTTRKYGGSGLGLTICRQLVELMGGQIGVSSRVGDGSTFWFELPLVADVRSSSATSVAGAAAPMAAGVHVLVAEDNTINQKVARRFLEKLGCIVEIVENGEEALRRVESGAYDAVFMDCQMPRMDGYEATRRIRALPDRATLPIIAMTAHAMRGDREKCLEAGMSDYLSKPLQPEALAAIVAALGKPVITNEESAA